MLSDEGNVLGARRARRCNGRAVSPRRETGREGHIVHGVVYGVFRLIIRRILVSVLY